MLLKDIETVERKLVVKPEVTESSGQCDAAVVDDMMSGLEAMLEPGHMEKKRYVIICIQRLY